MLETDATKVKRRPGNTASLIYDQLRSDILNGELAPGMPLSQLVIAKASGTSRGPVREALRRLQQDQLVVAHPNQRFSVAAFDLPDLEAVLSLHLTIVTLSMQVAVPFLTDHELQNLTRCAGLMEDTLRRDDGIGWEAAYREFILTILRHTGDRTTLLSLHLHDDIQRYRANLPHKVPRAWYAGGREFRRSPRLRPLVTASTPPRSTQVTWAAYRPSCLRAPHRPTMRHACAVLSLPCCLQQT